MYVYTSVFQVMWLLPGFCLFIFSELNMCLFVRLFSNNTWPSTFLPWLIKASSLVTGVGDIIKAMKLFNGGILIEKRDVTRVKLMLLNHTDCKMSSKIQSLTEPKSHTYSQQNPAVW